jgi:hypothetical protein
VAVVDRPLVFGPGSADRAALLAHFAAHGWVVADVLAPAAAASLSGWVDDVAALPDGVGDVLQHREGTDAGPILCRTEGFVTVHAELARLLRSGELPELAGALLGEPAVLYKEKVNHKLPGGAGYSAHQDAPAYPLIDTHVTAMVAVDDASPDTGCLEVASGCHRSLLPVDGRGCVDAAVARELEWQPVPVRAGQTLWFHSLTPHRSGPNRSAHPRRALYPTYNAAREGDRRAEYYAAKRAAFENAEPGDRARVSLIGDFEGRPA